MIESSLIAGTQPAGAASLLMGVTGAPPAKTPGAAGATGEGAEGRGDGFRERFEASVGLDGAVADTATRAGGERTSSVGTGLFGRQLGVIDLGTRPVAGGGGDGGVSHHVLAVGDSEDVLDGAPAAIPGGAVVTTQTDEDLDAIKPTAETAVETQLMPHYTSPVGAAQPKQQVDDVDKGSPDADGVDEKGLQVAAVPQPVVRESEPTGKIADRVSVDDGVEIDAKVLGAEDKSTTAVGGDAAQVGTGLKATPSGVAGNKVLSTQGSRGVVPGSGVRSHRDGARLGKSETQVGDAKEHVAGVLPASVPPEGVAKSNVILAPVVMESTPVAVNLPTSPELLPLKSDPIVEGKSLVAVPARIVGGPVLSAVAGKQDEAVPAAQSKSNGIGARGSKKQAGVGPAAVASDAVAATPLMMTPSFTATLPSVPPATSTPATAKLDMPLAPRTAAIAGTGSPLIRTVGSTPKAQSAGSNPVVETVTNFGDVVKAVASSGDVNTAATPVLNAAEDVAQAKSQGLEERSQEPKIESTAKNVSVEPVSAPAEASDTIPGVKTAHATVIAAESADSLLPSIETASATPSTTVPVRMGGAIKNAPGGRTSAVNGTSANAPTVNSPSTPVPEVSAADDRPTGVTGKGAGQPAVEAKTAPAHAAQETAPNIFATPVSAQVHAGAVADSKVVSADTQGFTARSAELASIARSENSLEHTTLVSTPSVLEVGVASGTNGWLKVRAEMDGTGGVAASVVATTASAAEALHKELPALSAYLRDESVGVSSLVVNRADAGAMSQDATTNLGSGSFGAGSQPGRGAQSGASDVPVQTKPLGDAVESVMRSTRFDNAGASMVTGYTGGSGGWLNVVA